MKVVNVVLTTLIVMLSVSVAMAGDQTGLPYELDRQSTDEVIRHRTFPSFEALSAFADSNAEYLGSTLWGSPLDVFVEGNYAYCAYPSGLAIFDISNHALPSLVSTVYLVENDAPYGELHKQGNYVYLANYTAINGLVIVDVADPLNPFLAATHVFRHAKFVLTHNNLAFIYSSLAQNLQILNIADPLNPDSLNTITGYSSVRSLFALDTLLFVGNYRDLRIYHVSDTAAPDSVGGFPLADSLGVLSVHVIDTMAYLIDGRNNLRILNVSNLAAPVEISIYDPPGRAYQISVIDTLAYILSRSPQSMHVLNIKNPAAPDSIGSLMDTLSSTTNMQVLDSTVYLVNLESGFQIVDVSDPTNPVLQGSHNRATEVLNVSVLDSLAYVACGSSGLQIVNISDPAAPSPIGSYQTGSVQGAVAVDSLVYVATDAGLTILNAVDPVNPVFVGSLGIGATCKDVFVVNNLAYVAAASAGLYIIDVSDPANPDSISHWDGNESSLLNKVMVVDSLAYLADESGLIILNVADSANPLTLSFLQTFQEEASLSLAVQDTIVYLGLDGVGFWVVDAADPTNIDTIAWYDNGDVANGMCIQDSLLYLTAWDTGIEIVNISDPTSPVKVGFHDTPGYAVGICVSDSVVYVADKSSLILLKTPFGLAVGIDDESGPDLLPSGFEVSQNHPNPFNPSTTIEYNLPRRTHVTVSVYNLLGRKIATLVDRVQSYGPQRVVWDGRNAQGKTVATGVYFYRVEADGITESRKMVLLK